MTCQTCGGVINGSWMNYERACLCAQRASDKPAGIVFGPDVFLTVMADLTAPRVPWQLTVEDKNLLRSMRIGVD